MAPESWSGLEKSFVVLMSHWDEEAVCPLWGSEKADAESVGVSVVTVDALVGAVCVGVTIALVVKYVPVDHVDQTPSE
jgi:hypothetical protein